MKEQTVKHGGSIVMSERENLKPEEKVKIAKKYLGQHRIIRRERAARDFAIKNRRFPAAILCVLQGEATTFQRKSAAGRR